LPSQAAAQVAIEDGCAHLQRAVRVVKRPLHLLFLDYPSGDEGTDGGFSE
jgi:hypothetical protein